METMTPLHSAIASARLISSLSAESNSWCLVPQGVFYVPVYFMLNHALDVAYMGREIDCHRVLLEYVLPENARVGSLVHSTCLYA